ncbi:hypothetical protein JKP88DRAFT_280590 [Tribonema minus]|uniref:Cyclic nucleotide-binding domain-containing protein n=1 Tax=Tribonema minus TaxID=303371 RepID=A0A835YP57_9STRA|nr:hypothetical protein JKP88DRAFT_280590 [Tribonema minus]
MSRSPAPGGGSSRQPSNSPKRKRPRQLSPLADKYEPQPALQSDSSSHQVFPEWLSERKDFRQIFGHGDLSEGRGKLVRSLRAPPENRTLADLQTIAAYFQTSDVLAPLGGKIHADLARTVLFQEVPAGTTLVRQGDIGLEFFIILAGAVHVVVDGQDVADLTDGCTFGEKANVVEDGQDVADLTDGCTFGEKASAALENSEPRNATITSTAPTQVVIVKAINYHRAMNRRAALTKQHMVELLANHFECAQTWAIGRVIGFASSMSRHGYDAGQASADR